MKINALKNLTKIGSFQGNTYLNQLNYETDQN